MQPGQKMYDDKGNQVCLFPMTMMNITQWNGVGTLTHCCGHMADYGSNGVRTPVYAPFDMHMCYDPNTAAHTLFYCSDKKVVTPSGLQYVSIQVTHDNNPPYLQTVKQGEIFYHTGNASGGDYPVSGIHLHLDQSFEYDAHWYKTGLSCGGDCYTIRGSIDPQFVFYINDTAIYNDHGEDWKYFDGTQPGPTPPEPPVPPISGGNFKWWMAKRLMEVKKHGL